MRYHLLLLIVPAILGTAACAPYQCTNSYTPSDYIGNTRVPTDCALKDLECPRSWKSGVPQGSSTAKPLIDIKFVECHEGFLCCGYVPISSNTGDVLGHSGVTIGAGVDLGSKNASSLTAIGVSSGIVGQLEPYFGLAGNNAACAAIKLPLRMTCTDAQVLTEAVKNAIVAQVKQRYDLDRAINAKSFSSLPRGIRTAVADVWFQFGSPPAFPTFWNYVTVNDWENAVKELRNFYGPGANPPSGDLKRRNNEADIIEAALGTCDRSADVVFLVDESGSVSSPDFTLSLTFVRNVIDAFSDELLADESGTRFGLSVFDSSYSHEFGLSEYSSKSEYFAALESVYQSGGGTRLGNALTEVLSDQFTLQNGLRPVNLGFPRVLVVMTDGQSSDEVFTPAEKIRSENIVIYAIGIGNYNAYQLSPVASSPDHLSFLGDFTDLSEFAATLTASTCYEPQPLPLEEEVSGEVEKDELQYYTYSVAPNASLMVEINDKTGSTLAYASRSNPHPYVYDSDFGFSSASQSKKIIVISPDSESTKRQVTTHPIFISIAGASEGTTYTLVGSECDPTECQEGTNEQASNAKALQISKIFVIVFAFAGFANLFLF